MLHTQANWLFIDLNSYFASVEQEVRPELRGRPIGIVPVVAETTCCIAASYQAKAYKVKTGTSVTEARILCPHIELIEARPKLYVEYHHRILEAIERCIPVQSVMSCDEFACALLGRERDVKNATEIAYRIKQSIREVGTSLRCSIGLAPNRLLAKIAADMQKPDGLMLLEHRHLPAALYCLDLADIPGIGERMEQRIRSIGINTLRDLCGLSRERLHAIWGSVLGDRMWLWLRGEDFLEPAPDKLQTISRQHILAPNLRTRQNARDVCLKLLYACARRMRSEGLWAGGVGVNIGYLGLDYVYQAHTRITQCQDTITLQDHFLPLWDRSPCHIPASVSIMLTHLATVHNFDLFEHEADGRNRITDALDQLNTRYGHNTVYLGAIHNVKDAAPTRIPFGPPPPLSEF